MDRVRAYLLKPVQLRHKEWAICRTIVEVVLAIGLLCYQPSSRDAYVLTYLTKQWEYPPIVALKLIPKDELCPGEKRYEYIV